MKHEKQLLLDELEEYIGQSPSFVVTRYSNLVANKANEFRREMTKVGGHFEVVRKRVLVKAAQKRGIQLDLGVLPGHVGVLFNKTDDPIEIIKALVTYSDNNDKPFELLAARVDGSLIDAKDVERLAKLPGKQQMRAELLGLFEAPMAQTLSVFEALLTSLPYCLENKAQPQEKTSS